MQISSQKQFIGSILIAAIVAILFFVGTDSVTLGRFRTLMGSICMLFLPGWWITKVLFSCDEIDRVERFVLSFALSIALIPLLVFYANIAGIGISPWLVLVIICIIICLSYIYIIHTNKQMI